MKKAMIQLDKFLQPEEVAFGEKVFLTVSEGLPMPKHKKNKVDEPEAAEKLRIFRVKEATVDQHIEGSAATIQRYKGILG